MNYLSNFVDSLKELMELSDMKLNDLAKATKISKGSISTYLSGATAPTMKNLLKLAKYFDVSIDYLLGRSVEKLEFPKAKSYNFFIVLDKLIKENKLSVHKFAKEVGISNSSYYRWKNGAFPYLDQLITIADYFCVSTDYLLGLSDKR